MPNYIEYQKSISAEFKAYENRIRNIIDNRHWGEDGHFKEIILSNYLKRILPQNMSVGTGFVKNNNSITTQIDIIIYDNTFPVLFSEGDFVITTPENVIAIIEVKTRIISSKLEEYITKANHNAEIICSDTNKPLFNGIFSYNCNTRYCKIAEVLSNMDYSSITEHSPTQLCSNRLSNCVNHIVFDSQKFLKLWLTPQDNPLYYNHLPQPFYSLYSLPNDLAIAYFISNLQEFILRYTKGLYLEPLNEELYSFLYPLPNGKEEHLRERIFLT